MSSAKRTIRRAALRIPGLEASLSTSRFASVRSWDV
jgi:hypothetical protein